MNEKGKSKKCIWRDITAISCCIGINVAKRIIFIIFRLPQSGGMGNIDLRNFNLDGLVEEKMYIKPSGELQIANGWVKND